MQILITGANSGIGFEAAKQLLEQKHQVWIVCRDATKNKETIKLLRQYGDVIEAGVMDLQDLDSVRAFVDGFKSKTKQLNVLVNNAGVMGIPELRKTKQGYETHVGVNFLSHFLLTRLLIDLLKEGFKQTGISSRIVNVSSDAHLWANHPTSITQVFDGGETYEDDQQYGLSKLFQIWDTANINRQYASKSSNPEIISFALHPGIVATNIMRESGKTQEDLTKMIDPKADPSSSFKTSAEGGKTIVACVVNGLAELNAVPPFPEYSSQLLYYRDCQRVQKLAKLVKNQSRAIQLDETSRKLCKL